MKNTFAHFGDCRIIQSCIFLLVDFFPILVLEIARPCMLSQLMIPKSSANRLAPHVFSQKCFVDLIFGHRILVHFLRNFSSLVQSHFEI